MPYVSVEDPTRPATSPVTGIFTMPQASPTVIGYIGRVADDDARIATFLAAQADTPPKG